MPAEPSVTEPPAAVRKEVEQLRDVLREPTIPDKRVGRNLLVGTWNLRAFGGLTRRWESGPRDSPKRNLRDVVRIAEVVRRFDVVALQEVKGDLRALRDLMRALGPEWGFILTDVAGRQGTPGNDERLAFVFDTRRVKPSGLACELVVPTERRSVNEGAFERQFARTPYAVSFLADGHTTFLLVTLHVLYGKAPADRLGELRGIAQWLAGWAQEVENWGHNLVALGDFNIDREGDPLYEAFTSTGLEPAPGLKGLPRTITGTKPGEEKFYDQIAWFTRSGTPVLRMEYASGGSFDFVPHLLDANMTRGRLSWHVSDHYPLWTEFALD